MINFDRITFDDELITGQACIRGMHISVSQIVGMVARGAEIEEILLEYPCLEPEDVQQALEYAAWLAQRRIYQFKN
jgi:uncharacterized protein (DUF433 family)